MYQLLGFSLLLVLWLWSRTWKIPQPPPTPHEAAHHAWEAACHAWEAADDAVYEARDHVDAARLAGDDDAWTYWLNEERRREIKREAAFQRQQALEPLYARR